VIVRVLGCAAGGGVPQWNCACANCAAARAGVRPIRSQSSIALSADGDRWYLVNASPDVAWQIESFAPLQPRAQRGTPILGALFTDANVDHIGGLAVLRQAGTHCFVMRSSALVREIGIAEAAFAPFARSPHRWLDVELGTPIRSAGGFDDPIGSDLDVTAIAVPGLTPGYAGRRVERGAVVAYEVRDTRSGGVVLFAPVFAAIDDPLRGAIERADVAFLDGSFYDDDEMPAQGLGDKLARSLGHQPVGGEDGTLASIAELSNRRIFTHLNNSNPMLDSDSAAALTVAESGAEVAYDGMELRL
jgi:pyrroloquinoline quinone biosynthesis protein B